MIKVNKKLMDRCTVLNMLLIVKYGTDMPNISCDGIIQVNMAPIVKEFGTFEEFRKNATPELLIKHAQINESYEVFNTAVLEEMREEKMACIPYFNVDSSIELLMDELSLVYRIDRSADGMFQTKVFDSVEFEEYKSLNYVGPTIEVVKRYMLDSLIESIQEKIQKAIKQSKD